MPPTNDATTARAGELESALLACGRGETDAFARVYDLTCHRVYGAVLQAFGPGRPAEDATCAIYADLWHHAPHFDPVRSTGRAWVSAFARASVLRERRTAAGGPAAPDGGEVA
ncbi:DNA-directed RNA polymerase specialized sigma24 family protein [Nocardioides cavernae]|uniref:DNA-directed RNA polymerase specialized sigma24 family protein n=1 Tax=Nocardioides cavernae TaxID=1921566 RepID=A0A7Y9KTM0_9ACTN|nr:hypothetical protein [Nocardioides cavernae]NYE38590.1 DNA-directed RNA polymerase specialized sigma24 family protein [Nocardioides cavernae]